MHGKRSLAINAASDRLFLSSLVIGRLRIKMIGLIFLTILGAAGKAHLHNMYEEFKFECDEYEEYCILSKPQLQPLQTTGLWVAMSVKHTHNPGRCLSILATTTVVAPSSMTSGSSLLPTAGKS